MSDFTVDDASRFGAGRPDLRRGHIWISPHRRRRRHHEQLARSGRNAVEHSRLGRVGSEGFVFVGCLIARWLDPLAVTPEMRRYRGAERLTFSSIYLTPDGKRPAGRLAALCAKFMQYEDLFEYISDPQVAVMLYRELNEFDPSYELIGCAVEERLVDELQWRGEKEILGSRPDEDDRAKLETLKLRLLGRRLPPRWPVLGYDVCEFGHFYSPVFHEVLPGNFPEYQSHVNSSGLFASASVATQFIVEYQTYPHGEPGLYYVYEVSAPPQTICS